MARPKKKKLQFIGFTKVDGDKKTFVTAKLELFYIHALKDVMKSLYCTQSDALRWLLYHWAAKKSEMKLEIDKSFSDDGTEVDVEASVKDNVKDSGEVDLEVSTEISPEFGLDLNKNLTKNVVITDECKPTLVE